nr:MAG TPA: GCN4-pII/Tumor necrosis factor ligand superfamily, Glucocorticoid-Induced TNF Receptor Ligand.95A [Crassvirales sp.]
MEEMVKMERMEQMEKMVILMFHNQSLIITT